MMCCVFLFIWFPVLVICVKMGLYMVQMLVCGYGTSFSTKFYNLLPEKLLNLKYLSRIEHEFFLNCPGCR
jgi:hypothetical protein